MNKHRAAARDLRWGWKLFIDGIFNEHLSTDGTATNRITISKIQWCSCAIRHSSHVIKQWLTRWWSELKKENIVKNFKRIFFKYLFQSISSSTGRKLNESVSSYNNQNTQNFSLYVYYKKLHSLCEFIFHSECRVSNVGKWKTF